MRGKICCYMGCWVAGQWGKTKWSQWTLECNLVLFAGMKPFWW